MTENGVATIVVDAESLAPLGIELRDVILNALVQGARWQEDNDRLREEIGRLAAEIGRLRNKKAQECSNGDGPAAWCTDCLNAAVAAQATRDQALLPEPGAIPAAIRSSMVALTAERDAAHRAEDRMRLAMDNRVLDLDRARLAFDRRLRELLDQIRHELTKGGDAVG